MGTTTDKIVMKKKETLEIIDSIRIENPCSESWDAMTGDSKRRHCDSCNHSVEFISEMTKSEANSLIELKNGKRLCVRYKVNSFGEIIFKPESALVSRIWQRASLILATFMTLLGLTTSLSAECKGDSNTDSSRDEQTILGRMPIQVETLVPNRTNEPHILMGDVAIAYPQETKKPEIKPKK
jgi:hypothetical protein